MSPGDVGRLIKPFIFLDDFSISKSDGAIFGMHPHSGIATLTVILEGRVTYEDSTGASGILEEGGAEWMQAGNGVWHTGGPPEGSGVRGFQLWLALPAEDENAPAYSQYVAASDIQTVGPVRIILGKYGSASSPIQTRASINYLHVRLKDGEQWKYQPPEDHTVGWVAVSSGRLFTAGSTIEKEIAVFDESNEEINFVAKGDTEFVLGSSPKHPYQLVSGYYSVHTNQAALQKGEAHIKEIRKQLRIR
ncbi:pirin family protein [Polaromonas sp. P1(28)-8]|nr:pirin family protein [Polaromonas sp. P1(28)-8]